MCNAFKGISEWTMCFGAPWRAALGCEVSAAFNWVRPTQACDRSLSYCPILPPLVQSPFARAG